MSRHVRAVRESIAILAPVSASSSSSGSESSDDDTAPGQTGTHHHHHHHHVDNSDEEVEELEAKYKANDRVMFKHRLVGVGMVHAVALVIQVKTHWLSMHACISLSLSLSLWMVHAVARVTQVKTRSHANRVTDPESGEQHKGGFSYRLKTQSLAEKTIWMDEVCLVPVCRCIPSYHLATT